MMRDVKNSAGKLVCRVDDETGTVEIVRSGTKTLLRLLPDGTFDIHNE
jgi:hypothetical protein